MEMIPDREMMRLILVRTLLPAHTEGQPFDNLRFPAKQLKSLIEMGIEIFYKDS